MANTIRIKRSVTTNTPSSLAQGELAYSETGSPGGEGDLFIGTAGPSVTQITTTVLTGTDGVAAQPNSSAQDNQVITTGLGIDGADAGDATAITISLATTELATVAPVTGDSLVFDDVTDNLPKKQLFSAVPLSIFNDDLTHVTSITSGVGIVDSGTASVPDLALDFSELTDMTGAISGTTELILQDGTTESRKAASEIALSNFDNDSAWTADLQRLHFDYAFSTTTASADPGAGILRFNNATPASVTALYVDDLADNGDDLAWILDNLGSNDIIVVRSHVDPADYMMFQVSGALTDNTGWWTIPVTVLFSGALPGNTELLQLDVQWFSQGTAGTVTSVTAGVGLVNSGSASAVVLDFDFSELTDMTGTIAGTTEFIIQDGTTESRKAASEIALSFFNNDSAWEANQTLTTGTGIDGADAGSSGNFTMTLALDELSVTTATGADWLAFDDAGTSSKALISSFDVGLFDNATTEYVSENDTMPAGGAGWNWVNDEDTLSSDSDQHVPTQQSVKAYVDSAVTGALTHKGGYNAATNTPALDTGSPTLVIGDMYTVTTAGTFFTEAVEVGDVLISDVDSTDAALLSDWTIVQTNIDYASETVPGFIEIATQAEVDAASSTLLAVVPSYLHNTTFDGGSF